MESTNNLTLSHHWYKLTLNRLLSPNLLWNSWLKAYFLWQLITIALCSVFDNLSPLWLTPTVTVVTRHSKRHQKLQNYYSCNCISLLDCRKEFPSECFRISPLAYRRFLEKSRKSLQKVTLTVNISISYVNFGLINECKSDLCSGSSENKAWKNHSGLYGIWTHDLCDTVAVFYQPS